MSAATPLLSARALAVWRAERCLVRDLDLAVRPGDLVWVRGANGAGKTSLLRVLAGLAPADAGEVLRPARDPGSPGTGLAWVGHQPGLKRGLSVGEALDLDLALAGRPPDAARRAAALARFGLTDLAGRPVERLSAGQRRRVALARLLLGTATLWLLDEPHTHLDAGAVAILDQVLAEHLAHGGAVVLAAHQAPQVAGVRARELLLGAAA